MTEKPDPFAGLLEDAAVRMGVNEPDTRVDVVFALSAAISLKRIADALDGTSAGVDISESLCGARRSKYHEG